MKTITYTHKGWIGLCPVYLTDRGSEGADIAERIPCTEWFLRLNLWMFDLVGATNQYDHGLIPIRVTDRLATPKTVEVAE